MKRRDDSRQILMFADVIPNGVGGFTVTPRKPENEVNSKAAAKMLGISRVTLHQLVNHPEAAKILKWRWSTEKRGKRIWDVDSLHAYKQATKNSEFGGEAHGVLKL